MQIYNFMTIIQRVGPRQIFTSFKYYNEYCILNVLHAFALLEFPINAWKSVVYLRAI